MKASDKELLNGVIIGFRNLINDRYQYAGLSSKYELPASLDEQRMTMYRDFFLEQVYPHPEKRELLEEAFRSLDNYLKHPDKMMRIVFDSAAILFRHGSSIPKLLSTGMKAFRSFRVATEFETKLVRKARNSAKLPPYSIADINGFITSLRKRDIDEFVANTTELLEILYDRKLVRQLIQIMTELIAKMKKAPHSYSETEIAGLAIGLDMLIEGNRLFDSLPAADQRRVLNVIVAIEVDVLEELFAETRNELLGVMEDGSGHPFAFWSKRWEPTARPPLSLSGGNAQIMKAVFCFNQPKKAPLFADTESNFSTKFLCL